MSVTVTTTKEIIRTPQKQIKTPTIRPKNVLGKISPYPADVKVITAFQIAFWKLLKFCPEASESGLSNSLS